MIPSLHLNDYLRRFIPAAMKRSVGNQKLLEQALNSPFLTFTAVMGSEGFSAEDAKAVQLDAEDGLLRTPFPAFRYGIEIKGGGYVCGFVKREAGFLEMLSFFRSPEFKKPRYFYWARYTFCDPFGGASSSAYAVFDCEKLTEYKEETKKEAEAHENLMVKLNEEKRSIDHESFMAKVNAAKAGTISASEKAELEAEFAHASKAIRLLEDTRRKKMKHISFLNGVVSEFESVLAPAVKLLPDSVKLKDADTAEIMMVHYRTLSIICYEYLAPHNFMAVVRPSGPGRSVEWMRAREHFTLIHRHHQANSKEVVSGSTVAESSSETLRRCAHSRRAHTKLLKSARYRYKQGQTITVRATWVGPQEWKDTAGQTYQILTPVVR